MRARSQIPYKNPTPVGANDFGWKKNMWVQGYFLKFEKTEALHTELDERAEAATSSYSAAVDILLFIYLVLVAKNHIRRSDETVKVFSSWIFLHDIFERC